MVVVLKLPRPLGRALARNRLPNTGGQTRGLHPDPNESLFVQILFVGAVPPARGGVAQHGARLVIINRDPTELDPIADIVLHDPIGETLTKIDACLSR